MRRKLSKLMAYLLTFCMLMSLMPATAFAIPATHSHAICGAAHTDIGDHTGNCEDITWTAWDGTTDFPGGNVYLSNDITLEKTLKISSGTVNLCLNGKVLKISDSASVRGVLEVSEGATLNICDCQTTVHKFSPDESGLWVLDEENGTKSVSGGVITGGSVNVGSAINSYGTLRLYGGNIVGNHGSSRAVVYSTGAEFSMYGGSICGNTGDEWNEGVGLCLWNYEGKHQIRGGKIYENKTVVYDSPEGVGVYVSMGNLVLSGAVEIYDNKRGTENDNIYVAWNRSDMQEYSLIIDGELTNTTPIGVWARYEDIIIKADGTNVTDLTEYMDHFTPDNTGRELQLSFDKKNIKLLSPHNHPICGAETCTADHNLDGTAENHQSVTWIAWDGTDMDAGEPGIQLNAGNYYLSKDVNVTSDTGGIHPVGNVALCLNGHTISCESGAAITATISFDKTDDCLTLTDCAGTGLVTRPADDYSVTIWISSGKLEQYGGTIQATAADNQSTAIWNQNNGTFSQYGGTIESESRGIDSLNLSTVNLYGGTIEAAIRGIDASDTIVNLYGGNITAQYGLGAFVDTNVNLYNAVDIDGTTADIYVGTEGVITLSSEISKPAEPYSIAVDFNTPFTSGWNTYMSSATISDYFIPYSSEYIIKKNATSGELVFDVKPTTYTVKFDANGGSGTMTDQIIRVGTETALSETSFTRSGYKFGGWATSADGAKVYDDKQSVTDIASAGESITLFAVWTEKATITISDAQQQYDYTGESIAFNLNSPLTGFTVKYRVKDTTTWSDSVPTEVNIYDVKITRAEDADYKAYEMTFFGKLVINKALQAAPTTPAVVNETIKNKADGKITGVTTAMEYKKQGDADYTKISGTEITNLAAGTYLVRYKETETHSASGDKEIVIADGKTISATFDMDGHGTTTDGQSGKAYGDKVSEPTAPTDNDWKFIGWYKENTFVNEWDFANDTLADDTVIYAKWQEKKSVAIYEAAQTYYYDGNEKEFELSGTDAALAGFDIQYKIDGTYGSAKPTEFGSYDVKITRAYDGEYKAYSKEIIGGLVIAQSGTEFADKQILKDGTPTTTFTYGDTITVKIKPQATGQAAPAPMMLMSLTPPVENQMALYYNGTQVSDAVSADGEGYYTITLDTTSNLLPAGNVRLTAEYTGNDNMAGYSEPITLTLNKAASSVTAPVPVENLVYNGSEQTLISAATDVVGGTVKYKLEGGEYSTELPQATNAGTYTVYYKVFGDDYHNDTTENSVSVTIAKATQSAPTTPAAVAETIKGKADGKITGVTSNMEYKKQNDENYTGITGETVENLAIGTYFVRYKEDANHFASEDAQVVIAEGVMISVSFNSNEGTAVESKTCEYNQAITAPAEPTKDGFEFIAWYLEDTLTTKWTNEYLFTVDTTLYAKWVHGTVSDHEDHVDEVEANGLNDVAKTEETDIELIVQIEEALEGDTEQTAIKAVENAPSNFGFYDIKLEKSTGGNVTDASGVIEIKLPYDFTRKTNIKVYRHHGGSPEELTLLDSRAATPYVDGKCFVDKESGCIYIYSSKFSTYAVAYDAVRSSSGGGTTRYTVKFDTDGGSKVSNKTVTRNSTLAEPTEPTKDGYTFIGWFTDEELTKAYDFETKVTKNITLYAKWEKVEDDKQDENEGTTGKDECNGTIADNCPAVDFTDVDIAAWYHLNIDYVLENGLMKGTAIDKFAPNDNLTRAMLVTILYRAEGEPEMKNAQWFEDVEKGQWYSDAVSWATFNGITMGYGNGNFGPDDYITREQIAAILYRYAIYKGMDAVNLSENLGFADADEISEYAISAMNWAVGSGLIKGYENNTVRPLNNATRAEAAALLQRFLVNNK